jgi:hypothetical protein
VVLRLQLRELALCLRRQPEGPDEVATGIL